MKKETFVAASKNRKNLQIIESCLSDMVWGEKPRLRGIKIISMDDSNKNNSKELILWFDEAGKIRDDFTVISENGRNRMERLAKEYRDDLIAIFKREIQSVEQEFEYLK